MAKSTVTPLEHTLIGAAGGVMEVCMMQPMVAFKNAMQEGRPMPRGPVELYRGLLVRQSAFRRRRRRRRPRVRAFSRSRPRRRAATVMLLHKAVGESQRRDPSPA